MSDTPRDRPKPPDWLRIPMAEGAVSGDFAATDPVAGPAVHECAVDDCSVQGSSVQGSSVQDSSVKDSSVQDSSASGGDQANGVGELRLASMPSEAFWRTTSLEDMDDRQWESLCDGCGRCCLIKLEDEDTGRIHYTDVGCQLLDGDTCRCSDYPNRQTHVPDCVRLTPETVRTLGWLPPTCAYRLVREGIDLPWWHPLVSGDAETVVAAGISVQGRLSGSEQDVEPEDLIERIVRWPDRVPRKARALQAGKNADPGGQSPTRRGHAPRRSD